MQTALADLLAKRRDRAIAIILGVKERECDGYLPADASVKLRKVVLDQLNDFCELCLDLTSGLDRGDMVLNEVWLDKISEMHEAIMDLAVNGNGKH